MSDLKPCPFCGGEAHLSADTSHSTAFFIGCETEDCFGLMQWAETQAEAIAAWNTRALDPDAIRQAGYAQGYGDAETEISKSSLGRMVTMLAEQNLKLRAIDPAAIRERTLREAVRVHHQGVGAILALIDKVDG